MDKNNKQSKRDARQVSPSDGTEGNKAEPSERQRSDRRRFLKAGLAGIGLLPYVVPTVQSVAISVAQAQGFVPVFPEMGMKMMKQISPVGRRRGRGRGRGFSMKSS